MQCALQGLVSQVMRWLAVQGMSEDDVESVLDKVMMLFRYLQEKDVFEKYYKQHLAKRLLSGRTVSDDAERSLLVKLKTECGYQFTSKLESMFTDMKTSRDAMADYTARVAATPSSSDVDIELSVQASTASLFASWIRFAVGGGVCGPTTTKQCMPSPANCPNVWPLQPLCCNRFACVSWPHAVSTTVGAVHGRANACLGGGRC